MVTKPPYDEDKKKRSEKRRKGRSMVREELGQDGNLEDLELLPMDDEPNLQVDDFQNYGVRVQG